jgi:hypothetical protein
MQVRRLDSIGALYFLSKNIISVPACFDLGFPSALSSIEEACGMLLVPYLSSILQTLVLAFHKFQVTLGLQELLFFASGDRYDASCD